MVFINILFIMIMMIGGPRSIIKLDQQHVKNNYITMSYQVGINWDIANHMTFTSVGLSLSKNKTCKP